MLFGGFGLSNKKQMSAPAKHTWELARAVVITALPREEGAGRQHWGCHQGGGERRKGGYMHATHTDLAGRSSRLE